MEANLAVLHLKVVVTGCSTVGKSSMILTYCNKKYPSEYVPYTANDILPLPHVCEYGTQSVEMNIQDTAGAEDYDRLRPLVYPNTHIVLLLFDISAPQTFEAICAHWVPELRQHCTNVPIILVGTKTDLRTTDMAIISYQQGRDKARQIEAEDYFEISSKNMEGLEELFKRTMDAGSRYLKTQQKKKLTCSIA